MLVIRCDLDEIAAPYQNEIDINSDVGYQWVIFDHREQRTVDLQFQFKLAFLLGEEYITHINMAELIYAKFCIKFLVFALK